MNNATRKNRLFGEGYLRWKQQLEALKKRDVYTVRRLALEARHSFRYKYSGRVQLAFS